MLSPGNVAAPPAAATAVVPESVPPPGFAPMASVTVAVNAVAVFPCASSAVTWTAGVIGAPAVALDGCTETTRCVAAPAAILNGALDTVDNPPAAAVSVYPVPILSMLRVENVATPAAATTVAVPDRVPPPGLVPRATVTLPVNWVAVFPWASCAVTRTAGAMATPAVALLGCTLNTSCAAAPTVTLNAVLVAGVTPVAVAASV